MYYSLIILFGLVLEGSFFIGEALAEEPIFNLFRNLGPLGNIIGTDLNNMRIWAFVTTMTPDQLQDIYASGWNDPGILPLGRYNSSGNMSLRLVGSMVECINRDMINVGDRFNKTQLTSIYLDMMARDIA